MGKIHFFNVGCGDCTLIQNEGQSFLIDCHNIGEYNQYLPSSKHLRGVFITHQHTDHFSGLSYLKESGYTIDYLIYSPYIRRHGDNSVTYEEWSNFETLKDYFAKKGTELRTPFRQTDFNKRFWNCGTVSFEILAPFAELTESATRELHDACLVVGVYAGRRRFLISGDASDASLEKIARNTINYCNDVHRCSHHGSDNNAHLDFLKGANASYTVISTKTGVYENMPGEVALQRYRAHTKNRVYRTDRHGTVTWNF